MRSLLNFSGGHQMSHCAIDFFSWFFILAPNFVLPALPPYSCTLSCNFVNVYTSCYRVSARFPSCDCWGLAQCRNAIVWCFVLFCFVGKRTRFLYYVGVNSKKFYNESIKYVDLVVRYTILSLTVYTYRCRLLYTTPSEGMTNYRNGPQRTATGPQRTATD